MTDNNTMDEQAANELTDMLNKLVEAHVFMHGEPSRAKYFEALHALANVSGTIIGATEDELALKFFGKMLKARITIASNMSMPDDELPSAQPPQPQPEKSSRQLYEEAKEQQATIANLLADPALTPKQRNELEIAQAGLSGFILSPWFPVDMKRRLIMLAIFVFGLWQALDGNLEPLIWWLLLPMFSPRIVGFAALCLGGVIGMFGGKLRLKSN